MPLPTALFDYVLPDAAIAQTPADKRDHSKLMVVRRATKQVEHRHFYELPELLEGKTVLFRNNAKVIKARMFLKKPSSGEVELLLLRPSTNANTWWCLMRRSKRVHEGEVLLADGNPVATLRGKTETGEVLIEFATDPLILAEKYGTLPLPPYIHREREDARAALDSVRYQTVFAKESVAAAAPTAGLHFTPELIAQIEAKGHKFADVTLHVGLDTFRPIATETVEEHKIHTESYELSKEAAAALAGDEFTTRLAVGTTSLRTVEDYDRKGAQERSGDASLFIYPPQHVQAIDALITNFHLPKSTLLCLVSAFLTPGSTDGIAWLKDLYAEALSKGYRFYSYGDAMLIL